MFTISVTDISAQSRNHIVELLNGFLSIPRTSPTLLPQIDVKPVTPQEIKFIESPDMLIIGAEIYDNDPAELLRIRKIFPDTFLFGHSKNDTEDFQSLEKISQSGVDDVFGSEINASTFLRKILLLSKKQQAASNGTLILVDSGKGGVGKTSIAAALGSMFASAGKKVGIIDLDFESQDLTRFLHVRPFINEHLQLLLSQGRPLVDDSVKQCFIQNDTGIDCAPPVQEIEGLFDARSGVFRVFFSFLQAVDALYDIHIIDTAHVRGSLLKTLYRVADAIVLVVDNDPASLHASVSRARCIQESMSHATMLRIIENRSSKKKLHSELVKQEFLLASSVSEECWITRSIPEISKLGMWPGSGATFFELGNASTKQALVEVAASLGFTIESRINNLIPLSELSKQTARYVQSIRLLSQKVTLPSFPWSRGAKALAPTVTKPRQDDFLPIAMALPLIGGVSINPISTGAEN